eukprot:3255181-Amphidinium_carterae.1
MAPSAIAIAQLEDRMGNGRKDAQRRLPAKVWALVAVMVIVHSVCSICDRLGDVATHRMLPIPTGTRHSTPTPSPQVPPSVE